MHVIDKYQMDDERRPTRHLDSRNGMPSRITTTDSFRASTADSGIRTMSVTDRSTTLGSRATNGTLSSLSTDTPANDHDNSARQDHEDDSKPVRIYPTRVLASRCYEQAYVSYIDHPSAFFLQLDHFEKKYSELHQEINQFYSKNPMVDPSKEWKRGDFCIAKYTDGEFYRARIIETPEVTNTPGLYDIVFVDFGNWDKVASTDIHSLLPNFAKLTAQAVPCTLTKTLPRSHTWFDHPQAIKMFEDLVRDKHVNATFHMKSPKEHWPLMLVDLEVCSSKIDVHTFMQQANFIRKASNEEIYLEFMPLIKRVDFLIYGIRHADEENEDDDAYC